MTCLCLSCWYERGTLQFYVGKSNCYVVVLLGYVVLCYGYAMLYHNYHVMLCCAISYYECCVLILADLRVGEQMRIMYLCYHVVSAELLFS